MNEKQESTETFPLLQLHKEIIPLIISFLDMESLLSLRQVNYLLETLTRKPILNHLKVAQVICGNDCSFIIRADGTLYAWGKNEHGQLGLGHLNDQHSPQQVPGLKNVISIASESEHTLALTKDGQVFAWGKNEYGQLGLGHNIDQNSPQQVPTLNNIISIAVGKHHSFAVAREGKLYAWGQNLFNVLGLESGYFQISPQEMPMLKDLKSVTAREHHALALTNDGRVYAWGNNTNCQLGLGHGNTINNPEEVPNLKAVTSITTGSTHSLAIADNKLFAWGFNLFSQLGLGNREMVQNSPQEVPNLMNVVSMAAEECYTLALTKEGQLHSWGIDALGIRDLKNYKFEKSLETPDFKNFIDSISIKSNHALVLAQRGDVFVWHRNNIAPHLPQLQIIYHSYSKVRDSIIKRESKRKVLEGHIPLEIRKKLINKLNYLLFVGNTPLLSNFFKLSAQTLKLVDGLRNFINGKRFCTFNTLEDELQTYQKLNSRNTDNAKFKECLTNLTAIINAEKERLAQTDTVRQNVINSLPC